MHATVSMVDAIHACEYDGCDRCMVDIGTCSGGMPRSLSRHKPHASMCLLLLHACPVPLQYSMSIEGRTVLCAEAANTQPTHYMQAAPFTHPAQLVSAAHFRNPLDYLLTLSRLCALLNPQCNHCVNTTPYMSHTHLSRSPHTRWMHVAQVSRCQ
jgi:hypothetical protein